MRFAPAYRQDLQAIRSTLVTLPSGGAAIPLGQLAQVVKEEGPAVIFREDNRRYTPGKFSVRKRDLASTIADAQAQIAEKVHLPYDTHLEWAGEINQLHEATGRLVLIIPITLLVIAMLVYSSVKNWKDMLIVLVGIPVFTTLFLINWIFPPALIVTVPLKFLFGGWLLAWNFLDYPLGIRGLGIRARLRWVGKHFNAVTLFGLAWAALVIVPGTVLVLLPMGVAGATRLVLEEELREGRTWARTNR